jgi:hypothetical protein
MYGRIHSDETKVKLNEVLKGDKYPKSKIVFAYSGTAPTILKHEFVSYTEAAKHFNCSTMTISRYIKSDKLF